MKNYKNLIFTFIIIFLEKQLFGCTGILLKTAEDSYVYARTLEFGEDLKSQVLFIPRNQKFTALSPSGKTEGLKWSSKFSAIGINGFATTAFIDGVNEKGLAGGLFYFPDFAEYQDVPTKNYKQSLPVWQILTWILTSFASIEEVKKNITKVYVSKTKFTEMNEIVPVHLIIHDLSGKSLVIEYINGKLFLNDDTIGVVTNSPSFDWHLTNLRNYINLSSTNSKNKKMNGITLSQLGQGSGMLGLPGDFTPPSRFVRAFAFTQTASKAPTQQEGIFQAFHILNNFDIPKGVVINENGNIEYTSWTSAIDMKNKVFYFRPYDNFQLQKVDLMKMDLNAKKSKMIPMQRKEEIIDISNNLKTS